MITTSKSTKSKQIHSLGGIGKVARYCIKDKSGWEYFDTIWMAREYAVRMIQNELHAMSYWRKSTPAPIPIYTSPSCTTPVGVIRLVKIWDLGETFAWSTGKSVRMVSGYGDLGEHLKLSPTGYFYRTHGMKPL